MAIYSFRAQTFSRGKGQSAVAAAAYRSGEKLIDERTHEIKHYPSRAERVAFSQIMMPADAPDRFRSRQLLWNEVERVEVRCDARLAREFMLALPCELTDQQREWLVREFVREALTRRGYGADVNIHKPDKGDPRNYHCHVMFTDRQIGPAGFAETKDRAINSKAQLEQWRKRWADLTNHYLERFGHAARVDHRSLIAQGIDREPTIHLGWVATEMEARGAASDRGAIQASIHARNQLAAQIATDAAMLARLRLRAANENRLEIAIRDQDVAAIIEQLTRRRPTFGHRDLARFLARSLPQPAARIEVEAAVLAHPSIVPLATTPEGRVTRYTTRAILAAENQVLRTADKMARSRRHRLPWAAVKDVLAQPAYAGIDAEQMNALEHLARADQLTILIGRAGTGKSYTLNVLRQAYEREGFAVVGLAFTNKVAQNLSRDGFRQAATIHSELRALELGRRNWTANTIVVVDEAAMLSTEMLGKVIDRAEATGAKLILAGDDRQLPSIDRGGLLPELVERHSKAELTTVRRQREAEERQASQLLAAGKFAEGLAIYDRRHAIHWSGTQAEAMASLVAAWSADRAKNPEASGIVLAFTNADVDRLNNALRNAVRAGDAAEGRLQPETWLTTSRGAEPYAAGDRLQLTGNDRQRNLFNGQFGTVQAVSPERMTVRLDDRPDQLVSFDPREYAHFRHGFAGTIHKVQGDTLDRVTVYHTHHWRAEAAYVALTRHRDGVQMFVARETAGDLDQLAKQMSRSDQQRAATSFPEATPLPTRPLTAFERGRAAAQLPAAVNDREPQQAPTAEQGTDRSSDRPAALRREAASAQGAAAGTTQPTKERWRIRADGSFEQISAAATVTPEQEAAPVPVPPPRPPEAGRGAAVAPAVPTGRDDQRAAERRGLQRGDLRRVQQAHRSTRDQVNAFLTLAKDPAANLGEWLALDPPVPGLPQVRPAPTIEPPEQAPDQAAGRSAVAGWSESAGRVPQEASANRAVKRARGLAQLKAPRSTRELVDREMALAKHPASDLPAWLGLAPPNPAFLPQPIKEPRHADQTSDCTAGIGEPVRGDPLPDLRLRVDADRGAGVDVVRVSGGSDAGAGRPEDMQPVRTGGSDRPSELTPPAGLAGPQFRAIPPGPSTRITLSYGKPSLTGLSTAPGSGAPAAAPPGAETPASLQADSAPSEPSAPAAAPEPAPSSGPFRPIAANDDRANQVRRSAEEQASAAPPDAAPPGAVSAPPPPVSPPSVQPTEPKPADIAAAAREHTTPPHATPALDPVLAGMLAALKQQTETLGKQTTALSEQTAALKVVVERPAAPATPAAPAPHPEVRPQAEKPPQAASAGLSKPADRPRPSEAKPDAPRKPEDEFQKMLPSGRLVPMSEAERLVYEHKKRTGQLSSEGGQGSQAEHKGPTLSMGGRAPPR